MNERWQTRLIRVRPGASRTQVGGRRGDALVVRVTARPVAGEATEAALRAVATALGLRSRQVRLHRGATARDKVIAIDLAPDQLDPRWAALLGSASPGRVDS